MGALIADVNDVINGREILHIDHSRDGQRMRVIVWTPPEGERLGREESLQFERAGAGWRLARRGL
jgi:hypothetical protein